MKHLLGLLLGSILLFAGMIAFTLWDDDHNRGWTFGYYGEFNRTKTALEAIPGVVITRSGHNLDLTLEEFFFDVTWAGRTMQLFFQEGDPIRVMGHDEAVLALRRELELKATG